MGSYKELYDEMKSKYGDPNTDQSQGGNDSGSKYRKLYDEMKSKYGDPNTDQVETKAEETQDVVKGKPILESVERDDGIFSMQVPQKKAQTAPEETPAAVKPAFDRDQWLQDYAKEAERIFSPDQAYQEQKAREEYIKNQEDLRRNQEVTAKNLATLESWPEEDRQMLIQYAINDHRGRSLWDRSSTSATRAATALVEMQKKYDKDTIERMAESYRWYTNEIATNTMRDETAKEVQGKPGAAIVHSGIARLAGLAGSVTAPLDYLGQALGGTGQYSTLDPNAVGNLPNVYSSTVTQTVAKDIEGDGKSVGRKAASYLYQGGMSALDTGARLLASGGNPTVAATLAGLGTFGQTVSQASAQGATPAQAIAYGTVAAGIEALTEELPLDELVKTAKGGWKGWKPAIKKVFKQAGIEATEEEIGLIATTLAEMAILQEKASTNQRIQQLVTENGMSVEEANNQVMYELLGEAMDTAVVSAISGGLSSAGGSVVAYAGRDTGGAQTAQEGAEATQSQESKTEAVTPDTAAKQQQAQQGEPQSNVQKAVQEFRDTGKVSNRMAEVILNDAESVAALQKETGMELPYTASGRRNAVKDAVAQLSRNEDAKDLTSSTAEALLRNQEQPQEAKAEDPEETRRLAIEATMELVGLPKQETVENVDTSLNGQYNNDIKDGGNNYAENQNDRTAGAGNSAQGMAGVRQGYGYGDRGGRQPSGVAANSGILRVSTHLRNAFANRKHAGYELYDTTALPEAYERALAAGRDSDPVNGWCVTPKSAQELTEGSVRTFMNDNGTVGVGVAADGDIVAVFKNKNGGPKKALDTAMPAAIDMGGDRLDCYGEGLVKVYEDYGFIPVARVEFNPEYANPGWTPDKKTPYIYFMMHNGDSSAEVAQKMHSYPHKTKAELEALPTYGKDDYDAAMEYRNGLMDQESGEKPRESVVAAPAGFAGEFQQLQAEYGNLPAGENPVRPDDMPKSTDGRDRVSQTAVTVKGAKVTPDEFVPLLEQKVTEGALSYIPITNDQTVQKAMDSISEKGWVQAVADWKSEVNSGKAGADLTATGAILLNHAANAGDKAAWLEILDHYRMLGTNTAQGLQAMRILKTLEPSDKLYMVRESVKRMVKDMNLKQDISINEELAGAYRNAQTDREADQILKEITKDVARQIPATIKDKWTALRYLNMLGNLRTQVRNIAGNTGAGVTYWTKDEIGAALEHIFLKKENRTKSFAVSMPQIKAASADFDTVKNVIQNGGKYNDVGAQKAEFEQMVQDQRKIFRFAPLEGYRKATNWAMEKGDVIFSKAAYARALAGFLKARGIQETDYSKIDSKLMDDARLYAIKQAQEATFRDDNWLSKWVGKVGRRKDTPKAIKAVSEGVVPFRKTPANVLVRAEEFSPLGIINSAVKSIQAAKGNITGAELVDSWAKSLTGVGLYALGSYLGSLGMLTGGPDEDEDKEYFDQLNGYQNYALQLPGGLNFTIDFLSPMAIPMFLGAQTQKILEDGNTTLADWEKLFTSITDPLIQMSMLQGVSDTLDDIKYSDNNLLQFALNAMMSYLGQGLTNTMLGQIERSTEDKRMTTYVDKDSNIPVWLQKQLGKMSAKTPFWDFQQTPYINEWGEEERNPEGIKNWMYQMLSPSYIDKVNVDNVAKELYRLNEVQDEVNVFPDKAKTTFSYTDKNGKYHENYQLSMEEAEKLQRVEGQTKAEIVANLISSKDWKAMTDAQKASAISLVYSYASERARVNAISDYGGFSKAWMMNIRGKEADTIIRKVALGDISESVSALNKALDENWNTAEAAGNMETAWKAYSRLSSGAQAEIRKEAGESAAGKYIAAREAGVTNAEYVTVLKNVAGLKPQSGYKNVREIQQAQAVGKMSGLSNAEKEAMIRGYVSDGQDQNIDDMKDLFRDKNRSFSVNDYLTAWAISDKESGKGRKDRIIAEYRKRFNLDEATAEELYKIFG